MEISIVFNQVPSGDLVLPTEDGSKRCPVQYEGYQRRTEAIRLPKFILDIPKHRHLTERHVSLCSDGWVLMSDVVKIASQLTPLQHCKPQFSSIYGVYMAFRHLMCVGPEARPSCMYVVRATRGTMLVWDSTTIPGYTGSMSVPAKWAHRTLQYIERGVEGIFLDQSSPPVFYAKIHNGRYRALEANASFYGWNIAPGSQIELTQSQASLLV